MKKTAAVMLAFLMLAAVLVSGNSKAETEPSGADPIQLMLPESFPWEATEEEILAVLGRPGTEPVFGAFPDAEFRVYQFPALFAGYFGEFAIILRNGKTIEIDILLDTGEDRTMVLDQVLSVLAAKYGDPNSERFNLVLEIAEATGGTVEDPEGFEAAEKYLWELPDGRTVLFVADYQGIGIAVMDKNDLS